ncbi:MAG: LON peptidase substrate-binding domain-containing protein [Phycisphaerales bacterium]|nr:LON peptidase substrate-binding domain-containing protein [Phycisphaerales bacterium]
MSDESTIRVNFARPMPIFPLPYAALMPHAMLPLHIFEPRYRKMIGEVLDGPGQIALAVMDFSRPLLEDDAEAAGEGGGAVEIANVPVRLKPAVCVGQLVQHHAFPDGRYNIILHGVCRARIVRELPGVEQRLYRLAMLEPVGLTEEAAAEKAERAERGLRVEAGGGEPKARGGLGDRRGRLLRLMRETSLRDLSEADAVAKHLEDDAIPTSAILELVSIALIDDRELRYRLLEEGDVNRRGELIESQLAELRRLLDRAKPQVKSDAPKGCHWN